jgi:dipeptidyl aminopeptidase/acylaminoacyl peptidase
MWPNGIGQGTLRTVAIGADAPLTLAQPAIDAGMVIADFAVNQAGEVAISCRSPQYPCELWLATASGVNQLSHLYTELLTQRLTVAFDEIWYPSHDGAMVQGWLLAPPLIEPDQQYGLILHIHGVPTCHVEPGNAGYVAGVASDGGSRILCSSLVIRGAPKGMGGLASRHQSSLGCGRPT